MNPIKPRSSPRITPYKKLHVQISTESTCFNGVIWDIGGQGSCISLRTTADIPIHIDNRLMVRCQLKDYNVVWSDELFVGKVRWIKKEDGQTFLGIEFLDADEFFHPQIASLQERGSC